MKLGIDCLISQKKQIGKFALLANYGSVNENYEYSWDLLYKKYKNKFKKIFSPQHGLMGTEQANMIETPNAVEKNTGLEIISLYSSIRKAKRENLEDIDTIIVDLQDVGSKYYTYIYTMALLMKAAKENNKRVLILDRPNPLGGEKVLGNINLYNTFIGMYPIPIQHGMTIAELAMLFNHEFNINCELEVIEMDSWKRDLMVKDWTTPWVMLSPNMPYPETAMVYPGGCLLEGTNISEGRGTTRPFEILGAPFINSRELIEKLKQDKLFGVKFRPISFVPTFDKFSGKECHGLFVHITDALKFNAYLSYLAIIKNIYQLYQKEFEWKEPPYEYEYNELPIDIISGDPNIKKMIENNTSNLDMENFCKKTSVEFLRRRKKYLIY